MSGENSPPSDWLACITPPQMNFLQQRQTCRYGACWMVLAKPHIICAAPFRELTPSELYPSPLSSPHLPGHVNESGAHGSLASLHGPGGPRVVPRTRRRPARALSELPSATG